MRIVYADPTGKRKAANVANGTARPRKKTGVVDWGKKVGAKLGLTRKK